MPIKEHVKGKRKAPLPPICTKISNEKSTINQSEYNIPNDKIGSAPETISDAWLRRKRPAPLPPDTLFNRERLAGDEMNNLSAISKRVSDKSTVKTINLNIFEPNIHNDLQCVAKEINEVNVNFDTNNKHDDNRFRDQRTDQVWICGYCTLQNPFWKIICDACERIKPYNSPTRSNAQLRFSTNVDNDLSRANEKNVMNSVQMRSKASEGKVLNRNSMYVDVKASKEMPNKRNSLCLIKYGDQNVSPETLEMEKERIRSVIRAMNNRALAQKYPGKVDRNLTETRNVTPGKTATIFKPGKRNGYLKYDIEKDYNFPSTRRNDDNAPKEHDKWTAGIKAIKKAENNNNVKCNELVKEMRTYCDQKSQATQSGEQRKIPTAPKHAIRSGIENEILLKLYINFNNAIEVTVQRDMTLDEFKIFLYEQTMCANAKIYFNGLLLKNGEQSLAKYGITNRSCLYVNTENVVVQAYAKNEKKSVDVQTENVVPNNLTPKSDMKADRAQDIEGKVEEIEKKENNLEKVKTEQKATSKPLFDDAVQKNADGEKFLIEHVQLNRYTIERVPPNANINRVKYRGVYNYNPRCNPELAKFLKHKPANVLKKPVVTTTSQKDGNNVPNKTNPTTEPIKTEPITQYIELLSLDDSMDLTKNTELFECSVCLVDYQPLEGVILRNCLHTFCKDCIQNTIIHSDEAKVKCPYMDMEYSCDCLLQDREIKALLSKPEYDEYLAKSLRIAENQIENSFHCKTPDCKGWCIFEDDVNTFKCPICRLENCLTCRVIHDGLDCKQYQNMMKNNLDKNPENATTHAMLQEMIEKGEAMNCPACRIVLMKKWGCDWLKCSMCKTEICWITRGYRWGPGGKGDTSGGCKCGVDGFKCHPKCNYCH